LALHLRFLVSALITGLVLAFAACGCDSSEPEYEEYGEPADRPFPSEEVNRAKGLIDQGSVLYTQAVNSMSQVERDSLANEALDKYFRPAQAILERLAEEYPEHAGSIDGMQHDLMQKIDGVIKITGFGD
jgi:hypothetical protein